MRHVTFADRSDVIRFDAPDEIISAAARPAHDNETLGEMYPGAFWLRTAVSRPAKGMIPLRQERAFQKRAANAPVRPEGAFGDKQITRLSE